MLEADEIKRRMEAARILRGIGQSDLGLLFEEDGLGKSDPGRIERGQMPLDRARREAACRHLGVPERWFTAETVDEIVGLTPPSEAAQAVEVMRAALLAAARELAKGPGRGDEAPGRPGR